MQDNTLGPDIVRWSATDGNATKTSAGIRATSPVNPAGGALVEELSQDIPPDLAILLQTLEQDFEDNKIDQWKYINQREEILRSVNRIQQEEKPDIELQSLPLERPLMPRSTEFAKHMEYESLSSILEKRALLYKTEIAFTALDGKGKEVSILTWEKLYLKSVKIAAEISKLALGRNDTVVLLYKESEITDFCVALFGCLMAGVPAIPIHQDISIPEVFEIMQAASTKLVLFSESVNKDLDKLNASGQKIIWPNKLIRWRTTDMGSAKGSVLTTWLSKAKQINSNLRPESTAYIEFSRSPIGALRGIVMNRSTIAHQMLSLDDSLLSLPDAGGTISRSFKGFDRRKKIFFATLDMRFSIGLILGVFFTVYSGNKLVWASPSVMEIQGLYANLLTRIRASLLLADYIGLKRVTYDYQHSPNITRNFSKTQRVDFSSVKWVLVNALTLDGEFVEILGQRYLRPLGCRQPENAIIPMLTLSEYGGMVISLRDWIDRKDKSKSDFDLDDSYPGELSSVSIDKEALSRNVLKVIDINPSTDDNSPEALRVDSFGYPIPDATVAVVNPEQSTLVFKGEVGEIWINSACLPTEFFELKKETKLIFHARCRDENGYLDTEFLRTGLLGFTFKSKIYILGLYEDRIRQKITWLDYKIYDKRVSALSSANGTRNHYSSHLLTTLASNVRHVYDCTMFDIFVGNEYLPVAIVETEVIKRIRVSVDEHQAPNNLANSSNDKEGNQFVERIPLNEPALNVIAQQCFDVLFRYHKLRLYCVLIVDCDTLPKIMRSGGKEIANMLCKRRFLEGTLKGDFVKFFMKKSLGLIPRGEDVLGGIWSPYSSWLRSERLQGCPEQYSAVDFREKSVDDKTGALVSDFKSIVDLLKFRVASKGDEIAFQSIDLGKASSKPLTWKKFEHRIYAVCQYLIDKAPLRSGSYAILMYSLSEEFVIAVYACFLCGIIPIPMLPFDSNRIGEDFPAFVGVVKDFDVREVLVNEDVEKYLKNGPVSDMLKKMNSKKWNVQKIKNTAKLSKVSNLSTLKSKIVRYQLEANFRDDNSIAMVWINFTSDHYRVAAALNHRNILGICKVFKETCNLNSKSNIVGCVRHSAGIGFMQSAILGVYLGTTTYLSSPVTFAENPMAFFNSLARYKIKDVFVTEQMLKYAAIKFSPKGFSLSHLKNMMISSEGRIEINMLRKIAKAFQPTNLNVSSMSSVYCHFFNPFVSTRSYMTVAPVDLFLDPVALRQGYVSTVNKSEVVNALHLQDSGMVPVDTQVAIVNPETRHICKEGEFGEIWVCSEANVKSFTNGPNGPVDRFQSLQFAGRIEDGDPNVFYLRTGDLGFLHTVSITRKDTKTEENPIHATFKPLFILGRIADTFEVMGLHHFPIDIENTIESCHADIYRNGSCVFKCADFTIVVCESMKSTNLSSLVPIIVNTVLSKHHIIIDIVAFMKHGEFPISRLGTKQRARIIDAWIQGFIPIYAQYGVNYGENSMLELVKEVDEIDRECPQVALKNLALSFFG